MTQSQRIWAQSRERLAVAVSALGYPRELADLLAKQLKSPKSIDRMAAWMENVRPRSMETIADELLAICADRDAWREKAASREAQASYNMWLNSERRVEFDDEEEQGCCL